jgi:hypothetical protein
MEEITIALADVEINGGFNEAFIAELRKKALDAAARNETVAIRMCPGEDAEKSAVALAHCKRRLKHCANVSWG